MKLSLFFKDVQNTKAKPSCKWPPLKLRKIVSTLTKDNLLNKNADSVLCNTNEFAPRQESSCSQSTCRLEAPQDSGEELLEMASKALRSKRLFFQPGHTSSILEAADKFQFEDCIALAIESEDPYSDFRNSMTEMIEAYGLKYWEHLEELLALYLRMNRKKNHGLIIGAFMDIFESVSSTSFSHCAASSSSKNNLKVGVVEDQG